MSKGQIHRFLAIGLVACSTLIYEILLTRICGLRLYHHFTFLVISNCLLGMGASGTFLTLYQSRWKADERRWLSAFVAGYLLSLVSTYFVLLHFPIPNDLDLSKAGHLLGFVTFNLAGAVPFFFGGGVIAMLLALDAERVNQLYATDLMGAAAGCVACPLLLPFVGAGGVFVVTVLLALAAFVVVTYERARTAVVVPGLVLGGIGLALLPSFDERFPVPAKGFVTYLHELEKVLRGTKPFSTWTANSRIDLLAPAPGATYEVFGLGRHRAGLPPHPDYRAITQDATAGTVLVDFSNHLEALVLLHHSTYSAAVNLKPSASVFIIGLGGGNDVWAALSHGASSVKAVELNWPIVALHQNVARDFSRRLVEDRRVKLVVGEGRSALMRERKSYDLIQMSGVDTWTALASGAYVLAENYLYTQEAIELMYRRLEPGGILQITRFAATMEALRLLSNIHAALGSVSVGDLHKSVIMITAPDQVMATLLKKGHYTAGEQEKALDWAEQVGLEVVYTPMQKGATPLHAFLTAPDKTAMIEDFPRDISPTTDDRPYFFNYTRWNDPFSWKKHDSELPSASQGNPLFILTQLAVSIVLGVLLILLPLVRRGGVPKKRAGRYVTYFAGLGLGFILIEIALIQKMTLFLGQPVYSLTVTLFSLLVFTGLGSLVIAARIGTLDRRAWAIPAGLAVLSAVFVVLFPSLERAFITLPLAARAVIAVLSLAPFGLLLGVPFAYGLRVLHEREPELLPWAWAVNGCMSVVGSVLTVVISMNAGFRAVLAVACLVYFIAFMALSRELASSTATGSA